MASIWLQILFKDLCCAALSKQVIKYPEYSEYIEFDLTAMDVPRLNNDSLPVKKNTFRVNFLLISSSFKVSKMNKRKTD